MLFSILHGRILRTSVRACVALLFLSITSYAFAADRYWIATTSSNWNATANWSTVSGGTGGASVPGSSDVAIFDGKKGSVGNCTINVSVNVSGITIDSDYTGVIFQNANTVTIGTAGALLGGGTFQGGSSAITINGPITLTGTAFTSTSGILNIGDGVALTIGGGSFIHNNGTLRFVTSNNTTSGNLSLYNLTLDNTSTTTNNFNMSAGDVFTVNNTLAVTSTVHSTVINNGTIEAKGDMFFTDSQMNGGGTATILIDGTGPQTLTGQGTVGAGKMPMVNINKPSGVLNLSGVISVANNWTYTAGTIAAGTSKVAFVNNLTIIGNHTLNDVEFYGGSTCTMTIASGTTLTVSGTTYITGGSSINLSTGTLESKGDITITNTGIGGGGNATLLIDGTGTQTLTGSGVSNQGKLPIVNINKPSGTLILANIISTANNWNYTAGTVSPGTSRVVFAGNLTVTGSHVLNEIEFNASSSLYTITVNAGTTLTANGTTYLTGWNNLKINTGTIECLGDITITNTATGGGGTATLLIDGIGTQTLTGSGVANQGKLPIVNINKPSGILNLSGIISTANNWTYTAGTVSPGTSRLVFGGNATISGNQLLNDVEFNSSSSSYVVTLGSTITAVGTTYISGNNNMNINGGTLECRGDVTITNTAAGSGGNATLLIDGTGTQTLTGTATSGQGKLPIVTINKPSGVLNLAGVISVANNWTYIAGTISPGTSRVVFSGTLTVTGTQTLNDVEFNSAYSSYTVTLANASTVTANGSVYVTGGNSLSINTGTLSCKGNITITNTSTGGGGTATFLIDGTGTQTLTGSGTINQGRLPAITINKPSGTLNLASVITAPNNWLYVAGIIAPGTSKVAFAYGNMTVTGSHTLNDIEFSAGGGTGYTITIASGTMLTSLGTVTVSGTNSVTLNTGTVEVTGDFVVSNTQANGGGTATILFDGTNTQSFTSTTTEGSGKLPTININKSGGALNMAGVITVVGNWNYAAGTVNAGTSRVYFLNAGTLDAQGTTTTMNFYDVALGDSNTRTLMGNVNIDDVLSLGTGKIDLNANTCTMNLNSTSAITRSSGYVISESTNNAGKISLNIGSTTGAYVYPFATAGGSYIPLTFQLTSGNAGYVTISTYPTGSNNKPYPVTPDNVTNVDGAVGSDNSTNVIDRFWQIDKSGASGTATVTYTYASAEVTGGVTGKKNLLQAQRYNVTTNRWDPALTGQTANAAANTVTEPGITLFSPRALALSTNPLPIELTRFDAAIRDSLVILTWATATEKNNNFFLVEKTTDGNSFELVATVSGAGNSNQARHYSAVDHHPYPGTSYYRLVQTDYDGQKSFSKLVSIAYDPLSDTDLIVYPNPGNGDAINFLLRREVTDNQHTMTITIIDETGIRRDVGSMAVHQNSHHPYSIRFGEKLTPGLYAIIVTINTNAYTQKFVVHDK